jgi:hypothetical protein
MVMLLPCLCGAGWRRNIRSLKSLREDLQRSTWTVAGVEGCLSILISHWRISSFRVTESLAIGFLNR